MIFIDFLYTIVGTPLGYIMWACYLLVNNFGLAIIIFTVIVKAATFPLFLKQQKNMAKSLLFTPKVREIQQKYRNNRDKQQEELAKLQKEGYNPMGGCGTMLLTFLILFGVIDVVYKPMTHMEHLDWGDSGAVSAIVTRAKQTDYALTLLSNPDDLQVYLDFTENGDSALKIITQDYLDSLAEGAKENYSVQEQVTIPAEANFNINDAKAAIEYNKESVMATYNITEEQWKLLTNLSDDTVASLIDNTSRLSKEVKSALSMSKNATFASLRQELAALRVYTQHKEAFSDLAVTQETLDKLDRLSSNMQFLGLDLGETPGFEFPLLIIPILSLLMSIAQTIISQIIQKKTNPEMAQQQGCAKYVLFIMPLFSLYIAFQVPAGVGFYWAISYVFGIIQSLVIYKFWPTEKLKEQARLELEKKSGAIQATATVVDIDEKGNEVKVTRKMSDMSAKELKEYQRKKLEEARKADAEKYGDEDIPDLPPLDEDNSAASEDNTEDE
ncbi:MAG: membrane protein insertase YidC [Oscillospiraceae bacterium]|nr:membrane protein insertase YidC [Oscillospiraceae bacterium]